MTTSLKERILKLRNQGKTYDEIKDKLNCSKATISYHCQKHNLGGNDKKVLNSEDVSNINEYYKTHTIDETALQFKINRSTVIKHVNNKHIKLSDEEIKMNNYNHVKSHRQKIKEKAVDYKGGCCEKCNYDKCVRALEFHHLDPNEKDFHISSYTVLSWEKVKKELDKCILVCANCHREIHEEIEK